MTIAQQLKVKEFPFSIKDNNGNQIYFENSNGHWYRNEFDSNNNRIYLEDSDGWWCKKEYDSAGNQIYSEDSDGRIYDKRPKAITELTMDEIALKFNVPVSQLKIKK